MTQMMPDALESRTISIPGDGRRLDVALSEAAGLTRSRVAALMADGNVTVDGKVETKSGAKAKQGQIVILTIPAPKPAVPVAQEIPLTILYQDDDLAVVLKPCGMVVHPAAGNEDGTLVNALLHHLDHLSGIGGELRPGIVHRLDKDTSGLLMIAKNDQAHESLSEQLRERTMDKRYLAVVEGAPRPASGALKGFLFKDAVQNRVYVTDAPQRGAKTCETRYRTLESRNGLSLVECELVTGRTHQIRAQFAHAGHPLLGDGKYGRTDRRQKYQALYSYRLTFRFTTDAGSLDYLNGRSFAVADVPFVAEFFPDCPALRQKS